MKTLALGLLLGVLAVPITRADGVATNDCVRLLSSSTHFYTTAGGGISESTTTYFNLLDFTLKGPDTAEVAALTHTTREELKLLQTIAAKPTVTDPIAELQKLAPGLANHSPQLIAIISAELSSAIVTDITQADGQNIRQILKQQYAQMQKLQTLQSATSGRLAEALQVRQHPLIDTSYVNKKNRQQQTALDIFRGLVKDKKRNEFTQVEMQLAAAVDNTETIKNCFRQGADINTTDEAKNNALHLVAQYRGNQNPVKLLINYGAAVDAKNKNNLTPLLVALGVRDNQTKFN